VAVATAVVGAAEAVEVAVTDGPARKDSFGLGWRHELAPDILANLDAIDVVEVMIEDYLDRDGAGARAIQTLSSNVPIVLHGVSLGLASTVPVDDRRLDTLAKFVDAVRPRYWSEHLAYVRAGDVEVGHLIAPTRTMATAQATIRNIRRATNVVGHAPLMENIATLMAPPGSEMDEPAWLSEIVTAAECGLLLDLHNVYTNSINFGGDPFAFVAALPPESIHAIHLAGGQLIDEPRVGDAPPRQRVLDDHKHPIPEIVYDLLTEVGRRVRQPLTVLLEYDGAYPPFDELMTQIERARHALALGRRQSAVDSQRSAVSSGCER
jgi:uncharacterized protein (UPF0276 family)